jgi:hypothetical protein
MYVSVTWEISVLLCLLGSATMATYPSRCIFEYHDRTKHLYPRPKAGGRIINCGQGCGWSLL